MAGGAVVFAALGFPEYAILSLIMILFAGGSAAAYARFKPSDAARLRRLEAKVDLILRHLGLEYHDPVAAALSDEVKALADYPAQKIAAIKLHREQTGVGLKEAKDAVEAYLADRG
jgi:Ribosomal protein L7/L12 C-terminal domain